MDQVKEKQYYIAYFDILGYKDFFEKATKEEVIGIVSCIYDAISGIKGYLSQLSEIKMVPVIEKLDIKYIGFSDNFAFVLEVGTGQTEIYRLLAFLSTIADIQRNFLIRYGILVRGSIAKSFAFVFGNSIQGQGIIDVVKMEQEAIYSQIIIDQAIFSDIHKLHFMSEDELRFGEIVQSKIEEKQELDADEQKFINDIQGAYAMEQLALNWKERILLKSNDNKPFLNYMYSVGLAKIYENMNIPINVVENMLLQFNIGIPSGVSEKGYSERLMETHKKILTEKIKLYGNYDNIDIDDKVKLLERERIMKKYIWLWLYHKRICELYDMPEYQVQILFDVDVRVLKLTIRLCN